MGDAGSAVIYKANEQSTGVLVGVPSWGLSTKKDHVDVCMDITTDASSILNSYKKKGKYH